MNKVSLIGNLTTDPEIRHTTNGQVVTNIRIATNRGWKDQSGQTQEEVEYHQVVLWGRLAEIASQYFAKGRKVYIEGRLRTRNWAGQDGIKRYTTEIVGEEIMMLSPKSHDSASSAYSQNKGQESVQQQPQVETFEEDNVPMGDFSAGDNSSDIKLEDLPF